ncbi:MAG: sulfite exporter TauE/SafE family protein [Gammaproteobacteria bacterium]|nr:sulfite exporter TauE/SafE family protein [Gammaproteobacteria bacterium]
MDWWQQGLLFFISLIANILSAFAGGGAGLLQLPALIFLGLAFSTALATHKLASVFLGIGATVRNLKEDVVEKQFVFLILASGLPGVFIGANIILNIKDNYAEAALGVLTLSLGLYSRFRPELGQKQQPIHRNLRGFSIGAGVLFLIGVLNGSLTSGTGLFVTLWLVRWFGLEYKRAVAYTLILVGLFWNGTGAATLGLLGEVAWDWLPALILGSIIGGYTGAHLAIVKGNRLIKKTYEVITIVTGLALIF